MLVYVLINSYDDTIEGVYTESGKVAKEEEQVKQAMIARNREIERLTAQISEFKIIRQPYIDKAEALLVEEAEAKSVDSGGMFKQIRKERKRALRQADQITNSIHRLEDKILQYERLLQSELLNIFNRDYYWEEHYLEGE